MTWGFYLGFSAFESGLMHFGFGTTNTLLVSLVMVNTYRLCDLLICLIFGNGDSTIACNVARPWIHNCVNSFFGL